MASSVVLRVVLLSWAALAVLGESHQHQQIIAALFDPPFMQQMPKPVLAPQSVSSGWPAADQLPGAVKC